MSRRRRTERDSLLGDEDEPSLVRRIGIGCAVVGGAAILLIGAAGIVVGAQQRFATFGDGEDVDPTDPTDPDDDDDDELVDEEEEPGESEAEEERRRLAEMRERYRAGPYVRIESMIPSGRLLPQIDPTTVVNGRTSDNPWVVPGSEYRGGAMPSAAGGGPRLDHAEGEAVQQALTVLPRTPARIGVRSEDDAGGTSIQGYLVEFAGYQGHFYLPATVRTELGVVQAGGSEGATVYFAIPWPQRPDGSRADGGSPFDVTMRVANIDDAGRVSQPVERRLSVMSVGAGDVEVTLTMSEPTDLDLYVTDPSGATIYYGNTSDASGGRLDLDANAGCGSNMGINNEHIFWPAGLAPSGTYRVHVAHYSNCIQGRPLDYRITVSACGDTVVLAGHFDGRSDSSRCMQASPETRDHCQEVVTFEVPPCAPP